MSDQDQQRAEQIVREWADLLSGVEVSHASGLLLARWIREALTDARSDALTEAQEEIAAVTRLIEGEHPPLVTPMTHKLDAILWSTREWRARAEQAEAARDHYAGELGRQFQKLIDADATLQGLREALTANTERACRFNCDAESACGCPAHQTYRAALSAARSQEA